MSYGTTSECQVACNARSISISRRRKDTESSHVQAKGHVPTAEKEIYICEKSAGNLGDGMKGETWCGHTYSNITIAPGCFQQSWLIKNKGNALSYIHCR